MFIPNIEIIRVVQSNVSIPICNEAASFLLIFALDHELRIQIDDNKYLLQKHDVYLFPGESNVSFLSSSTPAGSAVLLYFAVKDESFRQMIQLLGPKLQVDAIFARSCILNIKNAQLIQQDCLNDCICYNILSLLYYGYIGMQKCRSPIASLNCGMLFSPTSNETLNQVLNYIDDNIASDISIHRLSTAFLQSPGQLDELFKCEYGCTALQFISRFRLFKAKELMCYTNHSITEISSMTGFGSIHYFSRYFKEKEFISPTEYRRAFSRSEAENEL